MEKRLRHARGPVHDTSSLLCSVVVLERTTQISWQPALSVLQSYQIRSIFTTKGDFCLMDISMLINFRLDIFPGAQSESEKKRGEGDQR